VKAKSGGLENAIGLLECGDCGSIAEVSEKELTPTCFSIFARLIYN
jgi:hypothetical protein